MHPPILLNKFLFFRCNEKQYILLSVPTANFLVIP